MSSSNNPSDPCQACGHTGERSVHVAREMMFGTREEFSYAECASCGTLEQLNVPEDLSPYYPPNYYAFQPYFEPGGGRRIRLIRRARTLAVLRGPRFAWKALLAVEREEYRSEWERNSSLRALCHCRAGRNTSILDIGSGGGTFLRCLDAVGVKSLTGIDPYVAGSTTIGNGIRILKESIYEHQGQYDVVCLNHSFEHMPEPASVMAEITRLTKDKGRVIIRIPVAGCFAWRHYGTCFYGIDPPRHLFLYTPKGVEALARRTGLRVVKSWCDSYFKQFTASEMYRKDVPLMEQDPLRDYSREEVEQYWRKAAALNRRGDGDQAAFILRKA